MSNFALGRIASKDERDNTFLLRKLVPPPTRTSRYWNNNGWNGNQQSSSACVGFSFAKWIEDGPVTHKGIAPIIDPYLIYDEAQKLDPWKHTPHEGTDVRSGAKYLQSIGAISSYQWAWDLQTMINCVLMNGPVVIGVNWYNGMFTPNSEGLIKLSGNLEGGHAIVCNGANTKTKLFRLGNSWGLDWGIKGHCFISFDDVERLISEDGEICMGVENKIFK